MNRARLEALIEEATIDCNDEYEQFAGMEATLTDELVFPLKAIALGDPVTVTGIDSKSSFERGIMVTVEKEGTSYAFPLSELEFVDLDLESEEWIAAFQFWIDGTI